MFLFTAVPSLVVIEKGREYYRLLWGDGPSALRQTHPERVPPPQAVSDPLPDIQFVEFSLVAPDAKSVELAADFNRWRPETLPLELEEGGRWQVIVPLPPGEYHYAFRVDGAWVLDPDAEANGRRGERAASIRRVTAP